MGKICHKWFLGRNFFFFFWLCWVFVSVRGLSLVVASGGHSSSRCAGLSPSRPLSLRSTGSSRAGSVIVAHDLVAPRHVGSSQTRAQTHVPCIGRQTLNHCVTRETLGRTFDCWYLRRLQFRVFLVDNFWRNCRYE